MRPERRPRQPGSLARGIGIAAAIVAAGLVAAWRLDLDPRDLWPGPGGWRLLGEFLGRAPRPALGLEGEGADQAELWQLALLAAWRTVAFAAAGMSLALAGGLLGGYLAAGLRARGPISGAVVVLTRLVLGLLRSVHELIWAVLLLAALGTDPLAGVVAIAIPYAGVLGKVFAEMLDEAPRDAAAALAGAGATRSQQFLFAILPRAVPDMLAYTFYRFECALRSSAVLGFFGFPTLGYHIAASFENLYYGEVWTYLYVLFALVATVDWWSGRMRREVLA